jgi:hypothetical protein
MNRPVALMQVLGLLLAVVASGWAAEMNSEQAKAITEIEKLGGRVVVDEKSPDKPVLAVDYQGIEKVADAGLDNLKGLSQLQQLMLVGTKMLVCSPSHVLDFTPLCLYRCIDCCTVAASGCDSSFRF